MVQPLWRTGWRFLKKLKIELPYDPSWQIEGEKVEAVTDFFILASKTTVDGACSMKSEDVCFLAGKL